MTAYLSPKVAPFLNLERKFIRFPSSFLLSAATASADMAEVGRIKRGIVSPRVDRKVNIASEVPRQMLSKLLIQENLGPVMLL